MSARRDDLAELRTALAVGLQSWSEALLGPRNRQMSSRREWRWGNKGALSVVVSGPDRGKWFDHEAGQGGGPLDLVMHGARLPLAEAVEWARKAVGGSAELAQHRPAPRDRVADDRAANASETARIELARAIWAASVPIAGTVAETYLTTARAIPTPAAGWLDALRFHAPSRSLVAIATTAGGNITAVQRVRLSPAGSKDTAAPAAKGAPPGVAKPTTGVLSGTGAAVRLPGDPAGPVYLAEGPETGLSVWAATGCDVLIGLGKSNLPNVELPPGRRIVVCAEFGPDADYLPDAIARWRCAGVDVAVAWPWSSRPANGSDFNDLLRQDGIEAVRAALASAGSAPPAMPAPRRLMPYYSAPIEARADALARQRGIITDTINGGVLRAVVSREIAARQADKINDNMVPAEKATITRRIRRAVLAEHDLPTLPPASRVLVTGSQGSGKTAASIEAVASIRAEAVVWAVQPTRAKADEALADYRRVASHDSLPAMVVRGRSASDPKRPGKAMCPRHKVAQRAAEKGLNVREAICAHCPLRRECGTLRQDREIAFMGGRGLFLMARDYLFLPCPAPKPDILIADETVTMTAIANPMRVPPHIVKAALRYRGGDDLAEFIAAGAALDAMVAALQTPATLAAMRQAGVTIEALRRARGLIEAGMSETQTDISGAMSDDEIEQRLAALATDDAGRVLVLVSAVIREMATGRDTITGVTFDPAAEVRVDDRIELLPRFTVHRLHRVRHVRAGTTVLLLDGTGSLLLNRKLFGNVRHERVAIERDAHVTGTAGKSYSGQSITGRDRHGRTIANKTAAAAALRSDIATIAGRLGSPLVIASKRAADALATELPETAAVAHYGAVRGINAWEHRTAALVIGRESISIAALEEKARAFFADDPEPFVSFDVPTPADWPWQFWPCRATRGRRMRDGSVAAVEVEVHPDPRCQEILEQIREAECLQAGDRVRPIFNRRDMVFANDLVLDLTYDVVRSHAELVAGGDRFELAWQATGIIPLGGPDLHLAHPGLFTSPKAAGRALEKWAPIIPPTPNRECIWGWGSYRYRRPGQRGADSRVLIDPARHPDPRAALEAVVGPLAVFKPASQPAPELAAPMPQVEPNEPAAVLAPMQWQDRRPGEGNLAWLWRSSAWCAVARGAGITPRAGPW